MTDRIVHYVLIVAATMVSTVTAHAEGFFDELKKAVATGGNYTVRGRVQVQDGQWLTCFNDLKTGYLGPANLARPGDAQLDPATGNMKITTAAIPSIILTPEGIVTSNDCDSLAQQGLLVADGAAASVGAAQAPGRIHDKYGCFDGTEEEFRVADKEAIMVCQSRVITEREYAYQQGQRQAAQTKNADSATVDVASNAEHHAAVAKLQQDTAAQFKAIQSQGAMPAAPAPAQSDEDLAWDGAKLCGLKPAYMMKLKDEAAHFVRIDTASDRIILSEMVGGARQDIPLDGNAFAQRAAFNATAIGQGGDTCGRAFWNAEAFKAASAAMSGS